MRKPRGIKATQYWSTRWLTQSARMRVRDGGSLTLALGMTCLWRLSCGFAEELVRVFCPPHHHLRCYTPTEGKLCPFPHMIRSLSYMGEVLNIGGDV